MATQSPPLQHTFFSEMKPIKEIEQELNLLMKEFDEGKMQAFTDPETISRMDRIRQMQERLAHKHFNQDREVLSSREEGKGDPFHRDPSRTEELMRELDALTSEIQELKPVSLLDNSYSSLLSSPMLLKNQVHSRSPGSSIFPPAGDEAAERVWSGSPAPTPDTVRLSSVHLHESSLTPSSRLSQDGTIDSPAENSEGQPSLRPAKLAS